MPPRMLCIDPGRCKLYAALITRAAASLLLLVLLLDADDGDDDDKVKTGAGLRLTDKSCGNSAVPMTSRPSIGCDVEDDETGRLLSNPISQSNKQKNKFVGIFIQFNTPDGQIDDRRVQQIVDIHDQWLVQFSDDDFYKTVKYLYKP